MQGKGANKKHTAEQIVEAPPKKKANKHTAEQIVELSKRKRIRKKEAKKELIKKKPACHITA